jgi:type I restriction enzyme S subunit
MNAIHQLLTDHIDIWTAADTEKKSGRGRSSGNAASVYGIRKLRELILELAVRGKLVPQDANDEPASELLKRIQAKKAKLIAEGKIKKDKPLPPITDEDNSFEIPQGWERVRLGDVANSQAGFAFKSNGFNESGLGLPLIRIRDVGQAFTGTYFEGDYREEFVVMQGDYLISMDGEFRVAKWLNEKALLNQRVSRLIFFGSEMAREFIAEALQARLRELQGVKAYTTVDHLSGGQISNSVIAFPPVVEQHRIVAKVDELMALCDQLETQHSNAAEAHEKLVSHLLGTLTQSPNTVSPLCKRGAGGDLDWQRIAVHFDTLFTTEASIDALKQTLLQLAVMGKLVQQDPKDEPASELLKRIQAEKAKLIAEGKIKKAKPLPPITDEDKPFGLPNIWEWVRLEDLMAEFQNGASSRGDSDGESVVVLRLADIKDRCISLEEPRELLISPNMIEKYRLLLGDILVVRVNGSADLVGGFVVCEQSFDGIYCDHFIRMRISQKIINPRFLALVGASQLVRDRIKDLFVTTAGQKTVNQGHIGSLIIPLLSAAEQHRIVAKVDELMAICDQLKFRITKANQLQQKLADVLVDQAIS